MRKGNYLNIQELRSFFSPFSGLFRLGGEGANFVDIEIPVFLDSKASSKCFFFFDSFKKEILSGI